MLILRLFIFVLLFCLTLNTNAEDTDNLSDESEPEIVEIQSYRLPTTLKNASANVTIINRKDIDKHGSRNVAELLTRYGLHVEQSAGPGSISSVFLRGGDPNFTMVLLNGNKVNDPTNNRGGSFDISSLDVETIERIEIIRGPLSSIYGSDAISGVINIITREPNYGPQTTLNLVKGEQGLNAISTTFSQGWDTGDFSLTASYNDSGEQVDETNLINRSSDFKGNWYPNESTTINWHARLYDSDADAFPEDSGGSEFTVLQEVETRDVEESIVSFAVSHKIDSNTEVTFKSAYFQHDEEITSPGVAPGVRDPFGIPRNNSDGEFKRYSFTTSGLFTPLDTFSAIIGAELQVEDGETEGFLDFNNVLIPTNFDLKRTTPALFSESEITIFHGVTLKTGVRLDFPENFSNRASPNIGLNYQIPNTATNVHITWGKGFKLPSFFALGNPIVGDQNLKPETSETFEVGLLTNLWQDKGNISLNLFRQSFFDIIDFDSGPPPSLVNRSKVIAKGLELALSINPTKNISSSTFINFVDTDVKNSKDELLNRPEWRGGITFNWQTRENLTLNVSAIYVDDVLDSTIPTGKLKLDDYTRLDLSAIWKVQSYLDFILSIDNVLDSNYEETIGNQAAGLSSRFQIRRKF